MTQPDRRPSFTRLVVRQTSELLFARWHHYRAIIPPEKLGMLMVHIMLGAGLAHLPLRSRAGDWIGIADAATHARPITAQAIANSMRLPYTTVRRQIAMLVNNGFLARHPQGFTMAPAFFADEQFYGVADACTVDLGRVVAALVSADYPPAIKASHAGVLQLPSGVIERAALAFTLRAWENMTELYGDALFGMISAAIITANIRDVTADPALSRRYAAEDDIPPDSLRRPITLRALARAMNMPLETVRRRTAIMIARGFVQRTATGVIVPTRVLAGRRLRDNNRRVEQYFEQMLATLTALASSGDNPP